MYETLTAYFFNIIIVIPVVILLAIISIKLSRNGMDKLNTVSYIQVIERVYLSKDTSLYVIKMGQEGCILLGSQNNVEIIKNLDKDEVNKILRLKKEKNDLLSLAKLSQIDINSIIKKKSIRKEDYGNIK